MFESLFDHVNQKVREMFTFGLVVNVRRHGVPREDRVFIDIACRYIMLCTAVKETFVNESGGSLIKE